MKKQLKPQRAEKGPPPAAGPVHWNQAVKRFHVVTPKQAVRHARDPLRWVEPHQIVLLEKVIFPTIEKLLNASGNEGTVYVGERDFDLPSTHNGVDPVITPAMLEVVRRRYSMGLEGKEIEVDPLDELAVSISQIEPEGNSERGWAVTVHPHGQVVYDENDLAKTCCLEFR